LPVKILASKTKWIINMKKIFFLCIAVFLVGCETHVAQYEIDLPPKYIGVAPDAEATTYAKIESVIKKESCMMHTSPASLLVTAVDGKPRSTTTETTSPYVTIVPPGTHTFDVYILLFGPAPPKNDLLMRSLYELGLENQREHTLKQITGNFDAGKKYLLQYKKNTGEMGCGRIMKEDFTYYFEEAP
jgi:hypothetical protein